MSEIVDKFNDYISNKGLKNSSQRIEIAKVFIKANKHLTTEELYNMVNKNNSKISYSTVYRTMKLAHEALIVNKFKFDDGLTRYELITKREHHDHLICTKCGKYIEVVDKKIEELQEKLAKRYGFKILHHKMDLYGVCKECE